MRAQRIWVLAFMLTASLGCVFAQAANPPAANTPAGGAPTDQPKGDTPAQPAAQPVAPLRLQRAPSGQVTAVTDTNLTIQPMTQRAQATGTATTQSYTLNDATIYGALQQAATADLAVGQVATVITNGATDAPAAISIGVYKPANSGPDMAVKMQTAMLGPTTMMGMLRSGRVGLGRGGQGRGQGQGQGGQPQGQAAQARLIATAVYGVITAVKDGAVTLKTTTGDVVVSFDNTTTCLKVVDKTRADLAVNQHVTVVADKSAAQVVLTMDAAFTGPRGNGFGGNGRGNGRGPRVVG